MENGENEAIASFDTLYTNNHIQILKILLPYFDVAIQTRLAVMIKFLEFQFTMEHLRRHPIHLDSPGIFGDNQGNASRWDIVKIFSQIRNFCSPGERAMFEQLAALKKNMEMYEEMMGMMQLFSELAPDAKPASNNDAFGNLFGSKLTQDPDNKADSSPMDFNPMDMLKNMLSPEQQSMFDLFQSTLADGNENKKEE